MSDDWRLNVRLGDEHHGFSFLASMREASIELEARRRLGDRVAVSSEGPQVFLYADSEDRVREAEQVVRGLVAERELRLEELAVQRWHPVEERWEDPAVPLPQTPEEREAEHARLLEDERAEALATGRPEWEVRVELAEHGDAVALAERLEAEGLEPVRRWRYLLVGAPDEGTAHRLAARLLSELGEGAKVTVELTGEALERALPANPFAIFGGLAG